MDTKNIINTLKNVAVVVSLYIAQIALFWTFFEKFQGTPEWLTGMLESSPFASLTGVGWAIIGILEFLSVLLVVFSIFNAEFFMKNDLTWIKASIATGMVALAIMALGSSFANQFDSKASFIYYLGASTITLLIAEFYSKNEK